MHLFKNIVKITSMNHLKFLCLLCLGLFVCTGLSAQSVKGQNVKYVKYTGADSGSFGQTGPKKWAEYKTRSGSKALASFTEVNRDEWSVYLRKSDGLQIQLDLWTKTVKWSGKDQYNITESSLNNPNVGPPPSIVTVYADGYFKGASQSFGVGSHDMHTLRTVGNDRISSIKIKPGYTVIAYSDAGYRGQSRTYTKDVDFTSDFNDVISSIKVVQGGVAPPPPPPPPTSTNKNWMGKLPDDLSVAAISVPGTHDSGADYGSGDPFTKPFAQCQDWTVSQQLNTGVRYLDVRCRRSGNVFTIHHGAFYQKKNFGDILNDCRNFLRANPSETIFMRIKQEHTAADNSMAFKDIFNRYKANYPGIWYTGSTVPNLRQARGKIIILDNASLGMGLNYGNQSNQDKYNTGDVNYKWSQIEAQLNAAKNGSKSKLYLNHVSATAPKQLKTPRDMAEACNPKVNNYLSVRGEGRFGIIIMDFPSTNLINKIIASNKGAKAAPKVKATYRVEIDACHDDLTGTGTNGRITVEFYAGSSMVGGKYRDGPGDNCISSDDAYSITTDRAITHILVRTNSGDGYYIDELRMFRNGTLVQHHGRDNGSGWCVSTDANDAHGDWKGKVAGGACQSAVRFNY